jgi:phospholipid-translocating ATPase
MVMYFFYKNFTFTLCNFWFGFFSAFSAQTLYEFTQIMLYNVCFTVAPAGFIAVGDQEAPAEAMLEVCDGVCVCVCVCV